MPSLSVIERDFEKAIEIVKEEYPEVEEGSPQFWSLVFGVVKKMRGRKSARHLKYLGILTKGDVPDSLFYFPYMFAQRVRGIDLLMDLPEHPANLSPLSFPTFPAALSDLVDTMRQRLRRRRWSETEFANKVIDHIIENPPMFKLSDEEFERLLAGSVSLEISRKASEEETLNWKLVWMYAMLTKRIQPLTPRWGYKLAQLTKDVKEKAIQRINEHFQTTELPNPLDNFSSPVTLQYTDIVGANIVIPTFNTLYEELRAAIWKDVWQTGDAETYWISIRKLLSGIVPAWVAYALDLLGVIDINDVLFLPKPVLTPSDVLCAFVNDKFVDAPAEFPIYTKPMQKREISEKVAVHAEEARSGVVDLRDEILATLHSRWFL